MSDTVELVLPRQKYNKWLRRIHGAWVGVGDVRQLDGVIGGLLLPKREPERGEDATTNAATAL